MDLLEAQTYAAENVEKITSSIPAELAAEEEKFIAQMTKAKINPAKKLVALYLLMDKLNRFLSPYIPCKKKCSSCCHINVSITEIEIRHIEDFTKVKRNKQITPKRNFHGEPCPFLVNDSCSIYEARPFVCRRHVTLAPSNFWCHPTRTAGISIKTTPQFPLLGFSSINGTYDLIRNESNSLEAFDVRQIFSGKGMGIKLTVRNL